MDNTFQIPQKIKKQVNHCSICQKNKRRKDPSCSKTSSRVDVINLSRSCRDETVTEGARQVSGGARGCWGPSAGEGSVCHITWTP